LQEAKLRIEGKFGRIKGGRSWSFRGWSGSQSFAIEGVLDMAASGGTRSSNGSVETHCNMDPKEGGGQGKKKRKRSEGDDSPLLWFW